MKLRINEKMLKEGPGAGYTIRVNGIDNVNITSARLVQTDPDYGWIIEVDGTCTLDKVVADSYYYGTEELFDVEARVLKLYVEWYNEGLGYPQPEEMDESELIDLAKSELVNLDDEIRYNYGGGWMHSTYNGTIGEISDSRDDVVELVITDQEVIDYIDKAVTGDTIYDVYYVEDERDDIIEAFDDEKDAVAFAKEELASGNYSEVTVEKVVEKYLFGGEPDVDFYGDSEVVWQGQYERDEDFDDDEF